MKANTSVFIVAWAFSQQRATMRGGHSGPANLANTDYPEQLSMLESYEDISSLEDH